MPEMKCGGFRVWFGTDDAPAPLGTIPFGSEIAARVGVLPRLPELTIKIRYRRQNGAWMTIPAAVLPREGSETPQYYEAVFRDLAPGVVIEYTVQCQQGGRLLEPNESKTLTFEIKKVETSPRRIVSPIRQPLILTPKEMPGKITTDKPIKITPDQAQTVVPSTQSISVTPKPETTFGKPFPIEVHTPTQASTISSAAVPIKQPGILINSEVINRALKNNAGIDLMRMDLSRGSEDRNKLNLEGLNSSEKKGFIRDIQLRKGVLRASENAEIADALLKKGIISPGAISSARLSQEIGTSIARAETICKRDVQHYGRLSHGLFALWDAFRGGLQDTAVGNLRRAKVTELFDGLDNIQELFGDQDSCNCKHCNSVLGPAAYFVDLMHFIQTHVLDEKFKGNDNHVLHLKTRRPDLWVLPLTCENTNTEISQLQITSEIFENYIAKKHGMTITTDRKDVVTSVYGSFLTAGRHSVLQPFLLPLKELEIYLGHFNIRRSDIARLLEEPDDVQMRAALGMCQVQVDLITIPDASAININNKLGLTLPSDGVLPMKELLKVTQLCRKDLGDLLETKFVGGSQPLSIRAEKKSVESVQFDIERVYGITLGHMDRVHRLLRFKRYIPWTPKELDGFIAATGGVLDGACLASAGRAILLQQRFRASVEELCALAGDLPSFPLGNQKDSKNGKELTPVDVLFNVPDLVRQDGVYPKPTARFSAHDNSDIAKERTMRLRAGLCMDQSELTVLVEGLAHAFEQGTGANVSNVLMRLFTLRFRGSPRPARVAPPIDALPLPVLSDGDISFSLTVHNLSLLYRHAILGRWLKLNPTDLLTLIRLTPGVGNHLASLADVAAVVQFYDWWKSTPLTIGDLSLLLAPIEAIKEQVEDLWEALQTWLAEQQNPTITDTFFTQIAGISEELSRKIITLNKGVVFEADGDGYRVLTSWSDDNKLDLSPIDGTGLDSNAIRALVRSRHPDDRLPRALTDTLKIEIELARAIVDAALTDHTELTADVFFKQGPLPQTVLPVMDTVLRLHRLGTTLRLAPATLRFIVEHQTKFGITNWSNQDLQVLKRIVSIQALIKKSFSGELETALSDIGRLLADLSNLTTVASTLLKIEPSLAKDLAGSLRLPENPICALFKLETYAEIASKLSLDATSLSGIVSEDYNRASAASSAVLAGFRTKYPDETIWKEKIEPYQDRVLEKKRDALIDYLLYGPDAGFPDASEMYKYFLIDGEVDGCFRTSRIVAASSSLQLYVHRIRMNLEKEPGDGLHVEPSLIPDEEWEWRQHYRVWEANRKIFLWPENYLDPTIRDDKTPLFKDLESELLQQEITEQTVIDAYSNYLKALEELANLRYAGSYHHYIEDEDSGEVTDIIYLFGATGGDAPTHYWREIRNLARSQKDELVSPQFGPWKKVETRISTRHVSPVIYDGRLHVFWNEITTTSQNALDNGKSKFIGYSHRYILKFTSLRLDNCWTPPESVSLQGSSPSTFMETDSSIDDPLAELAEMKYFNIIFDEVYPLFSTYQNNMFLKQLKDVFERIKEQMKADLTVSGTGAFEWIVQQLATPRFGNEPHSKAREGYTLSGFMWERPYVLLDPSYGHRLLINCAGLLVRGGIDLFDRKVLCTSDTAFMVSPTVGSGLLSYRSEIESFLGTRFGHSDLSLSVSNVVLSNQSKVENLVGAKSVSSDLLSSIKGKPDLILLQRESGVLKQRSWPACSFDYPVAASLALNTQNLAVFGRHWKGYDWDGNPGWSTDALDVANVSQDAGVWAVTGTPGEVVIETEDDMLLLQPSATANNWYLLYRLGTTRVRDVARKLFTDGVNGLLAIGHQLGLSEPTPDVSGPRMTDCTEKNPIANDASYGIYYQEIFQHIPLLIAHHLNAQGKFEHAQRWFHYVFDPTSPEPPTETGAPPTDRNWKYRQFRGQEQPKLRALLSDTAAIEKYREDPFNVHAIARLRVSAYQKAVVMQYIDNLLDWADDLFTKFQMESVNEAMMLYVTAAEVLGPRPVQLGECGELSGETRTYDKLKDLISKDGEFLLEVEELIKQSTPVLPPTAGSGGLIRPIFGLPGLLTFPLSKAIQSTKGSVAVAVTPVSGIAAASGLNIKTSGEVLASTMPGIKLTSNITEPTKSSVGMASTPTSMMPVASGSTIKTGGEKMTSMALRAMPMMASTVSSSVTMNVVKDNSEPMVQNAMKSANAAIASKGTTGFIASTTTNFGGGAGEIAIGTAKTVVGNVATSAGIIGSPSTGVAAGSIFTGFVPFVKAAIAMPRTEELVKSFGLRQQFAFLGGNWKNNGGRFIPSTLGDHFSRAVVRQVVAAFCIPRNEILEDYWNRVEDRIQKIRTCRDITGRKRKLSLFAPPIDPMLLARARALGLALDDVLGAFEGTIPAYRFPHLIQKAKEFAGTVQSFGSALQSALERKDVEELTLLQSTQQQQILALTTKAKEWELESAQANLEATERRKRAVENRQAYYAGLISAGLNEWEVTQTVATHVASIIKAGSATLSLISGGLGLIPQVGSPFAMKYGGMELKEFPAKVATAIDTLGDISSLIATSAALEAGHERRREDWIFQRDQSKDELNQIEKQIEVATIACDLAQHAIKLHEKSIAQNEELRQYHEDKFSGLGLYTWLASQLQRTYREAYNMADRMARYAEQAYRFEREDYMSELLSGQYWDASHAGLLAGNRLTLDLQNLEQRYIETDLPKRELVDHVFSLRQWDPKALIELRQKGECKFKVPELFFDLASPGDYRRRLRSVRVTIPAIAGPYVNIMATFSLDSSQMRLEPSMDPQDAPRPRVDSISTSSARNDAGVFELNFRAEKYMPFEGAGAVSNWSLSLPSAIRMFDYDTISDVILHLDYTASFDGLHRNVVQGVTTGFVASVKDRLGSDGFIRAFNLREEFPSEYKRLIAGDIVNIEITADHFPFFIRSANINEANLIFTSSEEKSPVIGNVNFDDQLLGKPTDDEQIGGVNISLGAKGAVPWKHSIRIDTIPLNIEVYLLVRITISS